MHVHSTLVSLVLLNAVLVTAAPQQGAVAGKEVIEPATASEAVEAATIEGIPALEAAETSITEAAPVLETIAMAEGNEVNTTNPDLESEFTPNVPSGSCAYCTGAALGKWRSKCKSFIIWKVCPPNRAPRLDRCCQIKPYQNDWLKKRNPSCDKYIPSNAGEWNMFGGYPPEFSSGMQYDGGWGAAMEDWPGKEDWIKGLQKCDKGLEG